MAAPPLPFRENVSLKPFNTFGIEARARYYLELEEEAQLYALLNHPLFKQNRVLWLGGGSNMLLTDHFPGLVVRVALRGRSLTALNEEEVLLEAAAGENWHELTCFARQKELGGIENLSLIPGQVGTAPVQNIGAYGVELKDVFHSLQAFDLVQGHFVTFRKAACQFAYRNSIFKQAGKGRYLITRVVMRLQKPPHQLHLNYGSLQAEVARRSAAPTIETVAEAVIAIRRAKLPDPAEVGNSGSFFKNAVVSASVFKALKERFPEIKAFALEDGRYKLAAGWLIEAAGWKGYRRGDAGVHPQQALVLVNYGKAKGTEIATLAEEIAASVFRTFEVRLEAEVNII
ncbi:MAG: UDP-N-acetylmuramate dehydrogenase [Schleiferiaceae bacterium]|nr:UDP-N-acetylmuramate dehydrogenase [Schleiferiaceae bacterium]